MYHLLIHQVNGWRIYTAWFFAEVLNELVNRVFVSFFIAS